MTPGFSGESITWLDIGSQRDRESGSNWPSGWTPTVGTQIGEAVQVWQDLSGNDNHLASRAMLPFKVAQAARKSFTSMETTVC